MLIFLQAPKKSIATIHYWASVTVKMGVNEPKPARESSWNHPYVEVTISQVAWSTMTSESMTKVPFTGDIFGSPLDRYRAHGLLAFGLSEISGGGKRARTGRSSAGMNRGLLTSDALPLAGCDVWDNRSSFNFETS